MKGVVVYESHYGNTRTVAEAVAGELKANGYEVDLRNIKDRFARPPAGDILFVGSPVRFGSVSGVVKKLLDKLDKTEWDGKPIVVFTTILRMPDNATDKQRQAQDKYDIGAGRKLRDLAKSKGLNAAEKTLWVEVKGLKGPLVDSGFEHAKQFTHEVLESLKPQPDV